MFPAPFDYYRASSAEEAIELLGRHPDARLLAGGHSLIPMMKLRLAQPTALIDIGRLAELRGIREEEGTIRIGALTSHAELATAASLRKGCALLAEAAGEIGDPQVRHKGTIGGNIAHADPASDLPAVLVAVEGSVHLRGPRGSRRVAAREFFVDLLTTAAEPGEMITEVEVPRLPPGTGSCYLKVEHPASGYAVCGAAATMAVGEGGRCERASLAFNGVASVPVEAAAVAEALRGGPAGDEAIAAAVEEHLEISDPLGDIHASASYRASLARTYGRRALAEARRRAGG